MGGQEITCNCGHNFQEILGKYGCPNCEGESMTEKRPYATGTKRRTYTLPDDVHEALVKLGKGNASAGIREAVRLATK